MERLCNVAAVLLLGALVACGGGGGDPAGSDLVAARSAGQVSQPQGRGPGQRPGEACELEHVWVTVERIRISGGSGSDDVALASPRRIDLMGLQGGLLEALGVAPLSAGHYDALQLVLSPNGPPGAPDGLAHAVQVSGASPSPLSTPSGAQSGIRISLDVDVAPGQLGELELQFDACSSVVQAGNSGRYVLKPTLSARLLASRFAGEPARRVNTTTAGDQFDPHVAALAGGGYAIVWTQGSVIAGFSTYGQKFDAMGQPVGSELQLFDGATADGITGLRNGGAATVMRAPAATGKASAVLALRLDDALAAIGSAQIVVLGGEPDRPNNSEGNDIDALPDGGFLVTAQVTDPRPPSFTDHYVRRFDASGQAVSAPLRLPAHPPGEHIASPASTSVLSNGSWVSAWNEVFCRMGPCFNVQTFAALFSGADAQIGSLNVNPDPDADEVAAATAALRNGAYVLAWVVTTPVSEIQLQLFDQNGGATSPIIGLDMPADVSFGGPQLTALADGGFLLSAAPALPAPGDPATVTVMGQYFDATGQASGPLFPLGDARNPSGSVKRSQTWSVSALPSGGFVFTSELPTSGSGEDIYQRRFVPTGI